MNIEIEKTEISQGEMPFALVQGSPITELPKDLSELGELLEERFQLEDELIETLHNAHKEMIA